MRASHFQPALNGGELSPLLIARVDLNKHLVACRKLENFLPLLEGPITRRPGSRYVGPVADQAKRSWLKAFVFGPLDAFMLELGDQIIRFWWKGGLVQEEVSQPGGGDAPLFAPYTLASPYTAADLLGDDGRLTLQGARARDRLWFAGAGKQPRLLQRFGATNWTLGVFDPEDGPFEPENKDESRRLYASDHPNPGDTVTLTVPSTDPELFGAHHVGRYLRIWRNPATESRPWEGGEIQINSGEIRTSDGNYYLALNSGGTGSTRPIHTEGDAWDRVRNGVQWRYLHSGYGIVRLTSVTNGRTATGTVITTLPEGAIGSGSATYRWQLSAWDSVAGWPEAVGFGFDRLVFARGNRLWFSRTDDFFSFADRSFGQVLADDALTVTLTGPSITRVFWMQQTAGGLVVGTDGGEYLVGKANAAEVFGAVTDGTRNVQAIQQSETGASPVPPRLVHGRVMKIDATGLELQELDRRIEVDRLDAITLNVMAGHILGAGVTWQAWQGAPEKILWLGLADGSLASCTYLPEQEVVALARHRLGGIGSAAAFVEHGEVIPSDDGRRYDLWLIVRRQDGASTRRWVERLDETWTARPRGSAAQSRHLDAMLVYSGPPVTTIAGAGHLAGKTVPALLDGFVVKALAIDGQGEAALPFAASTVVLGLPYVSSVRLLVPAFGGTDGPGIGKLRRARKMVLTLIESADKFMAGASASLRRVDERPLALPVGKAVELVTDDVVVPVDLGWSRRPDLGVDVDGPLPFTLAAVMRASDVTE